MKKPKQRAALPGTAIKGDPCPDCGTPRISPNKGMGGKQYYRCNACITAYYKERREAAKRKQR